ncbi:uncharacterized protein MAM_05454 [Metarhizium album ARSEF 1941]|uniref:Alpha N-terminal protein methyltransferase 1 n=1 Tax=Metarhizium album (strain ARSEF 1941) TaxID=1081103 RepID=A0A0B2WKC7_METAS|nr:uncharacterized protein MAM_05454 [Metarhizium album ARSEF 1941]KHN96511.1 hypothetical protein MAM_05454 [Metarhizium album ARSEF 1941]
MQLHAITANNSNKEAAHNLETGQRPRSMSQRNDSPAAPDGRINTSQARAYWESAPVDVNGMLGGIPAHDGFSSLSQIDLQGSRTFLARFGIGTKRGRRTLTSTLEGGAGIGRVTEGLLLPVSEHVDVVEPICKFTAALQGRPGVRSIFNVGLEEWRPSPAREYDLIWVQWCLGHLTDEQVARFLTLAKAVLKPATGLVVVKENLSTSGTDVYDSTDSSVTRQDSSFRRIFRQAGMTVVRSELQRGLPERPTLKLLPVNMYALRP